jgi:hypothetical protein
MAAVAPGSRFPTWPAATLSALTAFALFTSFGCLAGRWPVGIGERQLSVRVELVPEWVGNQLRLGLVNYGPTAEFSVQVTGLTDPIGQRVPPQRWTVPWLEDSSVAPKRVLAGGAQSLDFARYDADAVSAECDTGHGTGCHWLFPAAGGPVGTRYYHLHSRDDLKLQRFTLTVRIMNADSGRYLDRQLTIGIRDDSLACEIMPVAS